MEGICRKKAGRRGRRRTEPPPSTNVVCRRTREKGRADFKLILQPLLLLFVCPSVPLCKTAQYSLLPPLAEICQITICPPLLLFGLFLFCGGSGGGFWIFFIALFYLFGGGRKEGGGEKGNKIKEGEGNFVRACEKLFPFLEEGGRKAKEEPLSSLFFLSLSLAPLP